MSTLYQRIIAGIGLSECAPLTHSAALDGQPKPGSIGHLLPATAARLLDPTTGDDLRVGDFAGQTMLA